MNFVYFSLFILTKISQKFVPKDPVNNKSSLIQIIAGSEIGGEPVSKPMMV